MKNLLLILAAGLFLAATVPRTFAADSTNEIKLAGLMVCGKCTLHLTDSCQNVLQVEKDGKIINYFLKQNAVSKDFHSNICQSDGEKVKVTGTVKKDGDKEILIASKIDPVK